MTTAATCETGDFTRSNVITCIPHLRAFAVHLAGDRRRADDLVRETIVQTFTAVNRPCAGISLEVRMFTALRRLHYGALRQSINGEARQPEPRSSKDDGVESGELLRIFRRLRDEQREALILAVASGLSYEQAAEMRLPDRHDQEPGIGGQARDIDDVAGGLAGEALVAWLVIAAPVVLVLTLVLTPVLRKVPAMAR